MQPTAKKPAKQPYMKLALTNHKPLRETSLPPMDQFNQAGGEGPWAMKLNAVHARDVTPPYRTASVNRLYTPERRLHPRNMH